MSVASLFDEMTLVSACPLVSTELFYLTARIGLAVDVQKSVANIHD